jgi:hypothetical protein
VARPTRVSRWAARPVTVCREVFAPGGFVAVVPPAPPGGKVPEVDPVAAVAGVVVELLGAVLLPLLGVVVAVEF